MLTEPGKHPWEKLYVWGSEPQLHLTGMYFRCPHCGFNIESLQIGDTEEQLLCTHDDDDDGDDGNASNASCPGTGLILSTIRSPEQVCAEIEQRIERAIRELNPEESENATGEPS